MSDINTTLRHGDMMYALGHGYGAVEARSAVLNALFTAQYRTLSEDEINAVIATVDAIIKKSLDEHSAIFHALA